MALTRRELELLDRRQRMQGIADEGTRGGVGYLRARRSLQRINEQITTPAKPAKPKPFDENKNKPGVQPMPTASPLPAPVTSPTVPPEAQPIAQSPLVPPTMDDAARDTAAASPLDPVAVALKQPMKRKKYGVGTTALTGETGLGSLGNVASKVLLG